MKVLILSVSLFGLTVAKGQELAYSLMPKTISTHQSTNQIRQTHKLKPASYSALGYNIPLGAKDIVIGGTTTVYKKFGFFVSYKVGIQNLMMPNHGERGDYFYDNVKQNGWPITGNTEQSTAWTFCGGLTVALAKKVPLYFGAGATRYREFFEYLDPNDNNKPKWNINPNRTRIEPNFCAGIFIPLFGRVIMNVGYEHNPQVVFVGLGIRGLYIFEDADEWWWGGNR
ncbi:MAG: hypothetical protein V4651_12785 [Bacteroidota bacterium]